MIILIAFLVTSMVASAQDKTVWETTVEGGYEVGTPSSDFEANRFALNIVTGVKVNNRLTVGVGVGARLYDDNSADNNILIPAFIRLKGDLTNGKRVTPYLLTDLGATMFPEYGWEYIGFISTFGAGVDVKVADRTYISFGLNYVSQHYDSNQRANAIGFATGFTF